jgi:hypothetical protein
MEVADGKHDFLEKEIDRAWIRYHNGGGQN